MTMISDAMVHRFLKDFSISLPVERKEFLDYYLETFDSYFDMKNKFDIFMKCRSYFANDEHFYTYRNRVVEQILSYIESHKKYIEFNNCNCKFDEGLLTTKLHNRDIFNLENVGKTFLSIDLVSGNFTAMKHFDKDLVKHAETWKEFMHIFSEFDYFAEAKHFRQVLLGKLNPKRIMRYERLLLERDILKFIIDDDKNNLKLEHIVSHNYDEIIFEVDKDFDECSVNVPESYKNDVHIEKFVLENITPYKMFIKRNGTKMKFKCVNSKLFPQVYKHVMGLPLHEKDMYFISDTGHLSKYIEKLKFEEEES